MLSNASLWHHRDFLVVPISTACYLMNQSPHTSIVFKISEVWLGDLVDYSILSVFGYCFAYINNGKLTPKATKCIFLGCAFESKGYQLWCANSKEVI